MTTETGSVTDVPTAALNAAKSTTENLTSMLDDFLSAYSTSASANDHPQSKHQFTGRAPRSI